jgi:hypothetical protein
MVITEGEIQTTKAIEEERKLALQHKETFLEMYELLQEEMRDLKKMKASKNNSKEWQEQWDKTYGPKETFVSVGGKLTAMQKATVATLADIEKKTYVTTSDDVEVYEHFVNKIRAECRSDLIDEGYRLCAEPTVFVPPEDAEIHYYPFLSDGSVDPRYLAAQAAKGVYPCPEILPRPPGSYYTG